MKKPSSPAKSPTPVQRPSRGKPPLAPGDASPGADPGLPMPHDRDEGLPIAAEKPDPVIQQAHKDLESGQVDTDMRATPGLDAQRRDELVPRSKG